MTEREREREKQLREERVRRGLKIARGRAEHAEMPFAMHLPLDIYTLIGRYVRILLPLARSYNKRILVKPKICLPRESQYIPGHLGTQFALRAARDEGTETGHEYLFIFHRVLRRTGEPHKGFPSLSLRTYNAKAIAAPTVFYRKLRRKSIQAGGGGGGAIFRRLGEKDSNICCEYGYEVWMENIKMYRT